MPGGAYVEFRITRFVRQHAGRREGFEPSPKELPVERSKHRAAIENVQMRLGLVVQPGGQMPHLAPFPRTSATTMRVIMSWVQTER
jgi:hypothetical protein